MTGLWIGVGVLLIGADLFVIAVRTAYQESSLARLLSLREQSEIPANRAIALLQKLPRLTATLNLILVLTRFGLAGGMLWIVLNEWKISSGWGWLILAGVALILFGMEWGVYNRISGKPEQYALAYAPLARGLNILFGWLASPFVALTNPVAENSSTAGETMEQELIDLVNTAVGEKDVFKQDERRMIYSVFHLGETMAREIMVPRIDMFAMDVDTPPEQAIDGLLKSGFSRIPIYETTIDNLLGLLYTKDLLQVWRACEPIDSFRGLLRQPYFVPEAKRVDELLAEMQSQRIHLAIVVDEYGGIAGLVTLEDIVEEIVGEIQDEYDQAEESPYQELADGEVIFLGRVDLDDFNEIMDSELQKDEADTIGGFIYSQLGRIPQVGDNLRAGDLFLTVEQISARRIRKVRARRLSKEQKGKEEIDYANG